ncbi:MAG: hypothetical protein GEU83_10905 [Pseudonocardiaceae bacterium]|nr:hypothetical protein [Pseudonocardiaceae bacterium]
MRIGELAASVGKGLFAGLAGTAVMTVSSTLEANLSGRDASSMPADALSAALGVRPDSDTAWQRLNIVAHWGYGTAWGAVRGLIGAMGLRGPAAGVLHFATVWGGEQAVLPSLGVGSPTPQYGAAATATDVFHHVVYAAATSAAYEWLDRY